MKSNSSCLSEIARFFALGEVLNFERAPGKANENYFLATKHGNFVVKFIREHTLENLDKENYYLQHLKRHQIPVSPFLQSNNGDFVFSNNKSLAVCMERIKGNAPVVNLKTIAELGMFLAKVHSISCEGLPERQNWYRPSFIRNSLHEIEKTVGQQATSKYLKAYNSVEKIESLRFPQSILHGDFHPGNCLFKDSKLVAILDWEEVTCSAAVFDLAYVTICCCFVDSKFKPDLFHVLIESYSALRSLSFEEKDNFSLVVRFIGLVISTWTSLRFGLEHCDPDTQKWKNTYWELNLSKWSAEDSLATI